MTQLFQTDPPSLDHQVELAEMMLDSLGPGYIALHDLLGAMSLLIVGSLATACTDEDMTDFRNPTAQLKWFDDWSALTRKMVATARELQ